MDKLVRDHGRPPAVLAWPLGLRRAMFQPSGASRSLEFRPGAGSVGPNIILVRFSPRCVMFVCVVHALPGPAQQAAAPRARAAVCVTRACDSGVRFQWCWNGQMKTMSIADDAAAPLEPNAGSPALRATIEFGEIVRENSANIGDGQFPVLPVGTKIEYACEYAA